MKVKEKVSCDKCGQLFIPRSSRQHFCRKEIVKNCLVCGDKFVTYCSNDEKIVCSKPECKRKGKHMCEPVERVCKRCGEKFTTTSILQAYCYREKIKQCPCCGKEMRYVCQKDVNETCGDLQCQVNTIKNKRTQSALELTRVCKWCGKEFHPKNWRDVYCYDKHFKTCSICGKEFEIDPRSNAQTETCSKECMGKLMSQNHDYVKGMKTYKENLIEKYGVENSMQIPGVIDKLKETNLEKYGSEWYTQTDEYKERVKQTNLKKYGTEWYVGSKDALDKRIKTNLEKYGVENVSQLDSVKGTIRETFQKKYGADCAMHVPELAKKAIKNARFSKLEERICSLFDNYSIKYIHQYFIKKDDQSHLFDFYLPDYKLLVDADGLYYHSYMDDPDGLRVREDYDEVRLSLIPEDHRFYLIVEGQEDKQLKELVNLLESINGSLSNYDSKLFEWCRSIEFPYPQYTEKRMRSDYNSLIKYSNDEYVPQCRLGQSILKNFHRSIFDAKVGKNVSPLEGWNNDTMLKQVIRNRFIYQNSVDPSKVLAGFNISKICPCVSTFNPVLAKYLTLKYLDEFNTVFDPFSGFSGRLIGVSSTGKGYEGQDLNKNAVAESNQIISFLNLDRNKYSICCKDILQSEGEFDCLLTCPPYYKKEIYNEERIFKSCDDWITECLNRFKCKRYVFVVDESIIYADNIQEEIKSASHLNKVTEYVIVIDQYMKI